MKKIFYTLIAFSVTATSHAQIEKQANEYPLVSLSCKNEDGSRQKLKIGESLRLIEGGLQFGTLYININSDGTFPDPFPAPAFAYLGKDCRITPKNANISVGAIAAYCTAGDSKKTNYEQLNTDEVLVKDTAEGTFVTFVKMKDSQGKLMKHRITFKNPVSCSFFAR